jgi:hypothetical protein
VGFTGGMAEWSKAAVLKTVDRKVRGFESYSLRQNGSHILKGDGRWVLGVKDGQEIAVWPLAFSPSPLTLHPSAATSQTGRSTV